MHIHESPLDEGAVNRESEPGVEVWEGSEEERSGGWGAGSLAAAGSALSWQASPWAPRQGPQTAELQRSLSARLLQKSRPLFDPGSRAIARRGASLSRRLDRPRRPPPSPRKETKTTTVDGWRGGDLGIWPQKMGQIKSLVWKRPRWRPGRPLNTDYKFTLELFE